MDADAGQTAVGHREYHEPLDLCEHLAERSAHRLNADEAVHAVAAREEFPQGEHPLRNALARIGDSAQHQYRNRSPEQQQERVFPVAEECRDGNAHGDARREIDRREERDGSRLAVHREVEHPVMQPEHVGAGHGIDQRIDRGPSQDDRQRGHSPPPRGPELAVQSVLAPRAADHADSDKHGLLDDDDDDGRHDEGSVAQIGVEQIVRLVDDRLRHGLRLRNVRPFGDQPPELDHRARLPDRRHQLLKNLPVHEEIAGVAVDRHVGLRPADELPLVVRRNVDHAVDLAAVEQLPGLLHVRRFVGHIRIRPGVEGFDQAAARRRAACVHHTDRHVAQHLRAVGQRVGRGVDQHGEDEDQQHAAVGEDRAEFVPHHCAELLQVGGHLSCKTVHATISPRIFLPSPRVSDAADTEAVIRRTAADSPDRAASKPPGRRAASDRRKYRYRK